MQLEKMEEAGGRSSRRGSLDGPGASTSEPFWRTMKFPIVGASCPVDLYENSSWDLKRFTVIRKIADTKFGEVFEGVDTFSQRPVAIKSVRKFRLTRAMEVSLERLICIGSKIGAHPHLLTFWAVFADLTAVHLVMELCQSASDLLTQCQSESKMFVTSVLGPITSALGFLHSMGILHRNISTRAIMVRPSGAVALAAWDCVIDTQVSRPVSANVGVPKFCPPEAFVHSQGGSSAARVDVPEAVRRPHSVKFDMWSLGVLCCVALGGKQPFMGSNEEQLQAKICGEDPQIPGFIAPLERDLIERLLQKEPAERPTALEVLAHPFVTKCLTPEERELFVALVTDGDAGTSLTPQLPTGTISVLPKPADAVTPARARVVPAEAARAARKVVMAESLTSASMDGAFVGAAAGPAAPHAASDSVMTRVVESSLPKPLLEAVLGQGNVRYDPIDNRRRAASSFYLEESGGGADAPGPQRVGEAPRPASHTEAESKAGRGGGQRLKSMLSRAANPSKDEERQAERRAPAPDPGLWATDIATTSAGGGTPRAGGQGSETSLPLLPGGLRRAAGAMGSGQAADALDSWGRSGRGAPALDVAASPPEPLASHRQHLPAMDTPASRSPGAATASPVFALGPLGPAGMVRTSSDAEPYEVARREGAGLFAGHTAPTHLVDKLRAGVLTRSKPEGGTPGTSRVAGAPPARGAGGGHPPLSPIRGPAGGAQVPARPNARGGVGGAVHGMLPSRERAGSVDKGAKAAGMAGPPHVGGGRAVTSSTSVNSPMGSAGMPGLRKGHLPPMATKP